MSNRKLGLLSVLFAASVACGRSTPTAASKTNSEDIRVVSGPSAVGSDATGLEWAAGWRVFVDAGTPPTDAPQAGGTLVRGLTAPVSVAEVSSTIVAADGRVLATLVTSAPQISTMNLIAVDTGTTQVTPSRGIVVNQHMLYDISASSPMSQALITVRLTDGNGAAHDVAIANEIRQDQERPQPGPCTRGQPSSMAIHIRPSGLDATELSAILGACVVFVNDDTVAHDIRSDPHLTHSSCPALNVGLVPAGSSRTSLTMNTWGLCGYHDELAPGDERFRGHLVIPAPK